MISLQQTIWATWNRQCTIEGEVKDVRQLVNYKEYYILTDVTENACYDIYYGEMKMLLYYTDKCHANEFKAHINTAQPKLQEYEQLAQIRQCYR